MCPRPFSDDPRIEITDRPIHRSCQATSKQRTDGLGCGISLLVTSNAFLGHKIRIGPRVPGRPIFIMNIYHHLVLSAFTNCLVKPGSPFLRTHVYETELNARNTPTLK